MAVQTAMNNNVDVDTDGSDSEENIPFDDSKYRELRSEHTTQESVITVRDQEFRLVDELPAIIYLDLATVGDPNADPVDQMDRMRNFIKYAVHPDDSGRFQSLLRSAQPVVGMEELVEIVQNMAEVLSQRPTQESSSSADTR